MVLLLNYHHLMWIYQLTWCNSLLLWRWLPHRLSKRQSLSTPTVLFSTTFTWMIILNPLTKEICYLLTCFPLPTCITLEDFLHVSFWFYLVIYLSFYFFDCSILATHSLFKCHLRTGPHFLVISGTCMGKGSELDLPCSLLNSLLDTVAYT